MKLRNNEATDWLAEMRERFTFDPEEEPILTAAVLNLDALLTAQTIVNDEGAMTVTREGTPRTHPAMKSIELHTRALGFALRSLDLPTESDEAGRFHSRGRIGGRTRKQA
jgi:hypothetical protein